MTHRERELARVRSTVDQKLAFGSEILDHLLVLIKEAEAMIPADASDMRAISKGWAVGMLVPEIPDESIVSLIVALLDRLEKAEAARKS